MRAGAVGAAAEGEVGPLLDGQDAGGVRPVLEACGRSVQYASSTVVRPTAPRRAYGIELVGAGQHRDRVELDRAEVAQHAADAGPAVRGAQESLGAQGDAAGLVGGEFGGGRRQGRHGPHARGRPLTIGVRPEVPGCGAARPPGRRMLAARGCRPRSARRQRRCGRYGAVDGRPRSEGSSEPTQQSRRVPLLMRAERRVPSMVKPALLGDRAGAVVADLGAPFQRGRRRASVKAQRATARTASAM